MNLLLVGAGGHARVVAEAAASSGHRIVAYADRQPAIWLDLPRISDDATPPETVEGFVMGIGGIAPAGLQNRLAVFRRYAARGIATVALRHARATVASDADIAAGAMVLAGAIVNPAAMIREAAIVNTGAIIEHEADIGTGAHIAPGAIVLGAARVGEAALVGAGAVVLPGAEVPAGTLVPALGRYPR
ncbi:MAG: hypothetical protein AB7G39_18220 [Alphaproteobacteria bacterium]